MTRTMLAAALVTAAATLAAAQNAPGGAAVTVIRNATIVTVTGPRIEGGTVIIRGDRIEAVGRDLPVPAGATVIDATGLSVYPGLIDSGTQLGLSEIGSVPGGNDTRELGDFNPHNVALTAINPHSEIIPTVRVNGITSAITGADGGLVSGWAALIDLAGWTPTEMAVAPQAGLVVTWPRTFGGGRFGGGGGGGGGQGGAEQVDRQVARLMEQFHAAQTYREARDRVAAAGGQPARRDLVLEGMLPALEGRAPVIFEASTEAQIRGALALADSFRLKPVIRGGTEAWRVAELLASRQVPVVVGPTTSAPGDTDPYDMIYANPGVLARAGVMIAFRTNAAADSRNLPFNAALAVAYGLDPDEALRALTINPATIWGVADRLGSIEPGKIANLIVTTGDPLDVRTGIRHVFIRGRLTPMDDRHTRLYQQFRRR